MLLMFSGRACSPVHCVRTTASLLSITSMGSDHSSSIQITGNVIASPGQSKLSTIGLFLLQMICEGIMPKAFDLQVVADW